MVTVRHDGRQGAALYRMFWRWHFYAGLFVLPFIVILSITGSIYLFKPQIERWEERAFRTPGAASVSADAQLAAALRVHPRARFNHYRLPERRGDPAMIQLTLAEGTLREVYVSPPGAVLGELEPDRRIAAVAARIHGSLLIGQAGDWLVELVASWTIVLVLTGLYLWWPLGSRLAGTVWPRLWLRGRPLFRDIHRVTGFWIAGLVLVTLASGLPWAGAWGGAFRWVRGELGLVHGPQGWKVGVQSDHAVHTAGGALPPVPRVQAGAGLPLAAFVARAHAERMAHPVLVLPPHAPQAFGPPTADVWTVKSAAQNRRLARQVTFDPRTGAEIGRSGFADQHVIDRIVNTGVAWHEGQLFGLANQIIGLATALALIVVSVLGLAMWLRRRPAGTLGAPPSAGGKPPRLLGVAVLVLGVLLPLFGLSVLAILAIERVAALLPARSRA